ncbi:prenyltransferase/squalene oxidase repeat-containing protein [Engelhardtia mirabilis]|uniref:Squalene cyclase C-terminal domain-containing protein n=1 Tax=Engelhardtia mirabilis TaxID=2528011 RepID=A0A518BFK5_9BACT|nr:hypothetical protein Pla133_08210 [Planctomycetes bacterium Pla133]QDV00081.1 hypothetical protein Pla86_08200 [Planctomycetes bacterium Pla86]
MLELAGLKIALAAVALTAAALPSPQEASEPGALDWAKAIDGAVDLLLECQESYVPDRPVGRLDEDELAPWQEAERARLRKLRSVKMAGVEWPYEGVYRVGPDGRIPPGYRVGGTAIVCLALIEAPGFAEDGGRRAAVERGARFMLEMLSDDPGLTAGPKASYDVRGWGHAYALTFFLRALDIDAFEHDQIAAAARESIPELIRCIAACEEEGGGWNYASGRISPFMTGSTLLALFHAAARDFEVDPALIERALDALELGRAENVAYAYAGPARGAVPMPGSAARSAIAELALSRAGRSDPASLLTAVEGFFECYDDLLDRKSQQGTHEGDYAIAPYYFFFGHTYVAQAIEALPEPARPPFREALRDKLASTRDANGTWNDRIFPRSASYSTAMAVLALLAPDLPATPDWRRKSEE